MGFFFDGYLKFRLQMNISGCLCIICNDFERQVAPARQKLNIPLDIARYLKFKLQINILNRCVYSDDMEGRVSPARQKLNIPLDI